MIEFKKHKNQPMKAIIHYESADKLTIEPEDEVGFKRVGEEVFIYRLNPSGVRYGNGMKVSKGKSVNKGYTIFGTVLENYANPDDTFEVSLEDPIWDDVNDVEMFELIKNE